MANNFEIKITAVDQASAAIDKVSKGIQKLGAPMRKLSDSFSTFGKIAGVDRVAKSVKSLGDAARDTARSIGSIVPAISTIAGIGTVGGIALLASDWGKAGAEIKRTAGILGVSTGDLQAFRGAAQLTGLSADNMTKSLAAVGTTMENAVANRDQGAFVLMQRLGIQLHRVKGGSVDAVRGLEDVAEAVASYKGNVQLQALIASGFGMESILPILQQGKAGIEKLRVEANSSGLVMNDSDLQKADRFNHMLLRLNASATRLKYSFGEKMAPGVERAMKAVQGLVDKYGDIVATKAGDAVEKFAKWVESVDWKKTADELGKYVDQIGGVKGIALGVAAITFAGPIAGVLSLITQLGVLSGAAIPAVVTALGRVALGPVGLGLAALGYSPDLNTGEKEYLASRQAKPGQQWPGDPIGEKRRAGAAKDPQTAGIVSRLMQMGWSEPQADGMAANLWTESLYNPSAVGDGGHAYGIGQWHEDRQAEFAKRFGIDMRKSSLDQQLQFMDYELRQGNEQTAGRALMGARTAQEAGGTVSRLWERPANADGEAVSRAQTAAAIAGSVHVDVHLHNAPPGTRATARARGSATAAARVGHANVTGPNV